AALEPAPAEPGGVQQVADVLAGQGRRVAGGAVVVIGLRVRDEGVAALPVGDGVAVGVGAVNHLPDAAGVAGDEVDGTGGGRPEGGVEGVFVVRKVLGLVPRPGHGFPMVVVHGVAGFGGRPGGLGAAAGAGGGDELVHLPAVERHLLRAVAVVLVASQDVV